MKRRHAVEFSLKEFHCKYLQDKRFLRLFKEWVKHGYQKQFKPSLDRINCKKGYSFANTQMLTWAENRFKQTMERRCRKGEVYQMLGNKIIKIFKSQREAAIQTGVSQSNLSNALTGKRKTAAGYMWSYENPELLNPPQGK